MTRVDAEEASEQWRMLDIYRQRYALTDELGPVLQLQNALDRRRTREAALERKQREIRTHLDQVTVELEAVKSEIRGTLVAGALLIEDILDKVRHERAERWSPVAVRGFRVWRLSDDEVLGNQVRWATPALESQCLRQIPGEDLPHGESRCGPPACGIYAVKQLDWFPADVAAVAMNNSVVGVVALTGKVIEHSQGYRAARARVIAVAARSQGRRLMTDEQELIEALFAKPALTLAHHGTSEAIESHEIREFLETSQRKEQRWI
jgi:hypothetical protein